MKIPNEFIQTQRNVFGVDGDAFIQDLPKLILRSSQKWGLSEIQPVSNLSYNFVAYAKRGAEDVVLKLGVPRDELTSEMAALNLFGGNGMCRLLECDESQGMLLLERLQPGMMLADLEDDQQATHIAADVMLNLQRPMLFEPEKFIQLTTWFEGFKDLRAQFNGGTGPLNARLVSMAEGITRDFFAEKYTPVLMHGDFHHFNIISSERGWLAIDPKGVIGPRGYELGPFLLNPWNQLMDGSSFQIKTERRVSILAERLGLGRDEIIKWGIAHAVLSAWWNLEDGEDWEYSMHCAELLSA